MPGGNNNQQFQINENGFLENSSYPIIKQMLADVNRTPILNCQPVMLEGLPTAYKDAKDYIKKTGHNNDRVNTTTALFLYYLMGVKNMSFQEAVLVNPPDQNKYQAHLKDFWKFIKDNPIRDMDAQNHEIEISKEDRAKSIKNWTDLYRNCTIQFSKYRLPDIDYSKPEEVGPYLHELTFFCSFLQDYTQEMEHFIRAYPAETKQIVGEYDNLYNGSGNFSELQGFADTLKRAQFPENISAKDKKMAAAYRVLLKDYSATVRGKTISETRNRGQIKFVDSQALISTLGVVVSSADAEFSADKVDKILKGQPEQALENKTKEIYRETLLSTRVKINNRFLELGSNVFRSHINAAVIKQPLKKAITDVFAGKPSNEEIIRRVKESQSGKVFNLINEAFHQLELEGLSALRRASGVELMDTIYIDGKTPAQLWGDKYASVKDPIQFQILLQAEVLNAYYTTDKEISIDIPQITPDYRIATVKVPLSKSPLLLRRSFDLLDRIDELQVEFYDQYKFRGRADDRVSAEEKQHFAPALEYEKMTETMLKCVKLAKSNTGQLDLFIDALEEYEKACKAYLKASDDLKRSGVDPTVGRSDAFKAAQEHHYTLAAKHAERMSEELQYIKAEARRLGYVFGDNDLYIEPGKVFEGAVQRKFANIKEDLTEEIEARSFDPKDFTAESRKTFYHEEDYQWTQSQKVVNPKDGSVKTVDPWNRSVKPEGHEFLEKELKIGDMEGSQYVFLYQGKTLIPKVEMTNKKGKKVSVSVNRPYLRAIGVSETREDSIMAVFCLWMMGEKGYGIDKIARMIKPPVLGANGKYLDQDLRDALERHKLEFFKFIEDHPLRSVMDNEGEKFEKKITVKTSEKEYAEDVKAWTDVLQNATAKMKEYRIPSIDYSDKDQVKSLEYEMLLFRELGINFGQEIPKMLNIDHPVKPTLEFICEQMGGEGKLHKMYQDWIVFQCLGTPMASGYFLPAGLNSETPLGMYAGKAAVIAHYRMEADFEMEPYKGKTIGEVIADYKGKGLGALTVQEKLIPRELEVGEEKFDSKSVFGYLSGRERKGFQNTHKKAYEKFYPKFTEFAETELHDRIATMGGFSIGARAEWLNDALRNLDEDPNSMLALLKQKSGRKIVNGQIVEDPSSNSIRHVIQHELLDVIGADYKGILGLYELELKDLFLIDGQTPEQRWGAKYANFSAADKKACIMGEIAKTLVLASAKVEIKNFALKPDGDIQETEPITVTENAQDLNRLSGRVEQLNYTVSKLREELISLQENLLATQDNRNNNRYHENNPKGNAKREGTDLYQNMSVLLDRCIQDLKEGSLCTQDEFTEHLKQLQRASEIYYDARFGRFIRPVKDKGKKRLTASGKIKKTVGNYVRRITDIRNGLNSNMYAASRVENNDDPTTLNKVSNAPIKDLLKFVKSAQIHTLRADSTAQQIEEQYTKDHAQSLLSYVRTEGNVNGHPNISDDLAKVYVYLQYSTEALRENGKLTAWDYKRLDNFQEEAQRLSKNPLFMHFLSTDMQKCVRDWNAIEKKAIAKKELLDADMNKMKQEHPTFANFITRKIGPLEKPKKQYSAEELAQLRGNAAETLSKTVKKTGELYAHPKERKQAYERLSQVTVMQLLTENTDTSERILLSIGADELAHERNPQLKENQTMKKLLKSAYSYFEGKKILEGKNVPEVLESLDNGKLKKELKTHLEKEFKAEMERNKNANRLVIQTADPVQVQPQAPHIGS